MQNPKKRSSLKPLVALAVVVVFGCIGAALYFGERSPIIAQGSVSLSETLTSQAQGMRTLYIIVRDAENPMPMPWGALSTTLSSEPNGTLYQFTLTRDNLRIMNQGQDAPNKIIIKARLDMDGLGGGDMPGDIVGTSSPVDFGSSNLVVQLTDLIGEGSGVVGQ